VAPPPSTPATGWPPLAWLGPLREPSGYADEGRAFLLAADRAGWAVAARSLDAYREDAGPPPWQRAAVERALARPLPASAVAVHHLVGGGGAPQRPDGPCVARTMFETDGLPAAWRASLLAFDEVWVPTEFNRESFERGGLPAESLHVLPQTLDFDLFAPGAAPLDLFTGREHERRGAVFLSSFDFTDRKGWDVLLEAWARAFAPGDDACLVLKCLALHVPEAELRARIDARLRGRRTAPVVLFTRLLRTEELPRLYAAADAFVLASRGEGWGRPSMEALAMGLPTIGTRCSGHLAFMHDGNSFLVDGRYVPVPDGAQGHTDLYRGHRWFEPDPDSLAAALQEVARDPDGARARAATARAELRDRFGPGPVAARLAELAEGALARWEERRTRPLACVWRGDFGSGQSLGIVNGRLTAALERGGHRVERRAPEAEAAPAGVPGVAQQWPPRFEPPSEGPFVLYQPWEFGCVPAAWVEPIRRSVDEVWVPSTAAREAFLAAGIGPELVHVVPNGVDLDRFRPDGPAHPLPPAATTFLYVGGTIWRKGVDLLLAAYADAFTEADDVLLVVKSFGSGTSYRQGSADAEVEAFAQRPGAPRLLLLRDDLPREALPALYRAADVAVQPYRGEGFCLPALEALACGRPVIATAGGPTDEFVTDACGWRIPSRRLALRDALPPELRAAGEGFVLEPHHGALVAALREAADPSVRAARARRARAQAERFSWERAARAAAERLEALRGRTPVRRLRAQVPGRKACLLATLPEWERPETWRPALLAYVRAFGPEDGTTLALPAPDPARAGALVEGALREAGLDAEALPDIVLLDGPDATAALELAADAVVCCNGARPSRAARMLAPDPESLRTFQEV
jgi:glycosyltransferase involved in cell wall biosynthesis